MAHLWLLTFCAHAGTHFLGHLCGVPWWVPARVCEWGEYVSLPGCCSIEQQSPQPIHHGHIMWAKTKPLLFGVAGCHSIYWPILIDTYSTVIYSLTRETLFCYGSNHRWIKEKAQAAVLKVLVQLCWDGAQTAAVFWGSPVILMHWQTWDPCITIDPPCHGRAGRDAYPRAPRRLGMTITERKITMQL